MPGAQHATAALLALLADMAVDALTSDVPSLSILLRAAVAVQ